MQIKVPQFIIVFTFLSISIQAQVGIGIVTPHPSAELHVYSTTRGFLPPVMTIIQRNLIGEPAEGLMVYCTDCSPIGYYLYNRIEWVSIMNPDVSTDGTFSNASNSTIPSQLAVKTYVNSIITTSMLVKTTLGINNYHTNLNNMSSVTTSANGNLAIGDYALNGLTDGTFNIGIGTNSLQANTTGSSNVAIGYNALVDNTTGTQNAVFGVNAGRRLLGSLNTMIGSQVGSVNLNGVKNVFVGYGSGGSSQSSSSVFIGYQAGKAEQNTNRLYIENSDSDTPLIGGDFSGDRVGINVVADNLSSGATLQVGGDLSVLNGISINEFSTDTTLFGSSDDILSAQKAIKTYVDNVPKLVKTTLGTDNYHSNLNNMSNVTSPAKDNLAIGVNTLQANTSGNGNLAVGNNALKSITTGGPNAVFGVNAGKSLNGSFNTMIGSNSGVNATGDENVFIGYNSGGNSDANLSVFIGTDAGYYEDTDYRLYIENSFSSTPLIGGDFSGNRVGINVVADNLSSGATLQVGGDLSVLNGTNINEFSTDGSLSGNSNHTLPTQAAVKSYVDSVGGIRGDLNYNYHFGLNNMLNVTSGSLNMAFGYNSLPNLTSGLWNTGIGYESLKELTTGSKNIAIGHFALNSLITGHDNIAIGNNAGEKIIGFVNTIIGSEAGSDATGSANIFIGRKGVTQKVTPRYLLGMELDFRKIIRICFISKTQIQILL